MSGGKIKRKRFPPNYKASKYAGKVREGVEDEAQP
jgi:hypothetical protein